MKTCILDQTLRSHNFPDESPFQILLPKSSSETGGCLLSSSPDIVEIIGRLSSPKISIGISLVTDHEMLLPPVREKILNSKLADELLQLYNMLYPQHHVEHFSRFYQYSNRASLWDKVFGSFQSTTERSSVIAAYWPTVGNNVINHHDVLPLSIGRIQFFLEHSVCLKKASETKKEMHYFAYVHWYMRHEHWDSYGSNCILSYPSLHTPSLFSFLPLSRIYSKCAHGYHVIKVGGIKDKIFIASPISLNN